MCCCIALHCVVIRRAGNYYGLAMFDEDVLTGRTSEGAYGHYGATFGADSTAAYFPALNLSIALATNIETTHQEAPPDAICFVYNAVRALLLGLGTAAPTCTFQPENYHGKCTCSH
jgi:hypothetical protein